MNADLVEVPAPYSVQAEGKVMLSPSTPCMSSPRSSPGPEVCFSPGRGVPPNGEVLGDVTRLGSVAPISPVDGSGGPIDVLCGSPRPSMSEVINFGGIANPTTVGLRSSDRLRAKPDADLPQLERAMGLVECRALSFSTCTNLSFVSIPHDVIVARASRLVVSLGSSPAVIKSSVDHLKALEESRNLTFLKNLLPPMEEVDTHSLTLRKASN